MTISDSQLDLMARVGDPAADLALIALAASIDIKDLDAALGHPDSETRRAHYGQLMRVISEGNELMVDLFINDGPQIDDIIDGDKVKRGQEFFERNGVAIITVLFLLALPESYLGRRGAQVLHLTGALGSDWTRRIVRTGEFLINVLTADPEIENGRTSLHSGGQAARAARTVRLIHAATRALILAQPGSDGSRDLYLLLDGEPDSLWAQRLSELDTPERPEDTAALPLCQEDLLATLTTFTTMTVEGLKKLGVEVSAQDEEDYHYVWNVIGWHLGIGDDLAMVEAGGKRVDEGGNPVAGLFTNNSLLPLNASEMEAHTDATRKRLQGETEEGQHLTRVLINKLSTPLPINGVDATAALTRYLIGDDQADKLGIDRGGLLALGIRTTGILDLAAALARKTGPGRLAVRLITGQLTQYAMRVFINATQGEGGMKVDDRLAAKWGVGPAEEFPEI